MSGDQHSARGFHYECALRCLWLLDLRGTENRLAIAEGEDAKVVRPDRRITYRQAKKREGGHWVYDRSLREFVERAYGRFCHDPSVRHEFYTNQAIPSGKSGLLYKQHLNPAHEGVLRSAPTKTKLFCETVRLFPEHYQPEPSLMLLVVKERLRDVIDSAYPGCQARNFVKDQEVDELAAKLLMFEYGLWSRKAAVGWREIDAELGLDRLISDLYSRSMADGTLTPFGTWPTVDKGGPDDEKTRAVEAVRGGRVLPRPKLEDEVWALIDEWWAGIGKGDAKARRSDYLVVVLAGAYGTGKTWSLMRIGNQIPARYNGVRVYVAAASPPDRPFAFGNLAISQPGPCAILIDDFFPDWSGLVLSITGPPPHPLLILGTAARPADDEEVRGLTQRLGRRAKVVELPDHLDDTEVEGLARDRGVSLSLTERSRAKATNIRHVAQLLSGISAPEHLSAMLGLLSSTETLDLLGPILMCTSLRVAVPKEFLERSVGRALPPELQPWVLGSRGAAGELLSLEDPDEAAGLLTQALGGARVQRMRDWCERFLRNVDPERLAERAFTRHLFRRLARKDPEICEHLLDSCRSTLDPVMAREPLWALIFSWLPILAGSRREELLKIALAKVTAAPATVAEIAVLIEAYGTAIAREHLGTWLTRLSSWNPALLARFVEAVMALPKDERRDTAVKLTSLLVDLPMNAFVETLSQRNCFNESTILASDFGRPDDRRAFLYRVGEMISVRLESGGTPKQNWFEASLVLTERVISQARFGLAMEIVRQMFIKGNMRFNAEEYYKTCFEQEQALVHRSLIDLGLKLLQDSDLHPRDSLPPVTGSLVAFAASWAGEEQWLRVADAFIELLESLSVGEVSFDRLSAMVLPTFSGMRRGPQHVSERFLKAILSWIPDERRLATVETAKLVLQVLGFVAAQPWIDERFQAWARKVLLELVRHSDSVEETVGALFEALRGAIGMLPTGSQRVRMPHEWIRHPSLANTYMTQVGRIRWEEQERIALGNQLIRTWQGIVESRQYLTEALLRLGDLVNAKRFADEMAKDVPSYPDSLGYLAVISVKAGDASRAEDYLAEAARMQDEHGRGLHPHLAHWVHRELAGACEGRRRVMHLLCSELCRDRPLRPYNEVVDEASE
jgi:hypothetical protein